MDLEKIKQMLWILKTTTFESRITLFWINCRLHTGLAITIFQSGLRPSFSHNMCALILYASGGTYGLKSTPNNRFVRNFFYGRFIFTLRVLEEILFFLHSY